MYAEDNKSEGDKISTGQSLGGVDFNMGGSFLVFRGAPMKDEWVKPYFNRLEKLIKLPQSTSVSKNPLVGIGFAIPEEIGEDKIPTLFVITCQNYNGIFGMTMNNEAYSSYPSEEEILLCEGCSLYVLAVDTNVKIDNNEG